MSGSLTRLWKSEARLWTTVDCLQIWVPAISPIPMHTCHSHCQVVESVSPPLESCLSCDFIWLIECDWSDWLSSQPSLYKALCLPLSFSPVEASCHVRKPRIGRWIMRDYVKRKRWWEGEVAISANTWYQDFNLGMLVKPSWTFWPYLNHSSWHHVEMRGDLPPLNTPQISDSKVIWLVF